ncbi:Crp/Fnr family transcriptional regulator [Jannaschia rubra]|uniref:Crp/Fnr family transcriptional regulator n=1 Tax=Jannaschia rubra TaxID=282197 RepID=UPI0024936965|nr:Crp/Fnr family transcriptional regulator [Jannaschia rubra]
MPIPCESCPLRRLPVFDPMTPEEVAFTQRFKVGEMVVDAGSVVMQEGLGSSQLFTVLEGLGLRYKTLPDGQRQIISFVMPGDFIGLQSAVMEDMGHSFRATTRMRLCVFDKRRLWTLFESHPDRAFDLTWLAADEERFLGETLASLGQRPAATRMAWLLLHLYRRGRELGLTDGATMPLPYRQQDMADALGLSLVHTNKTLARLREGGVVNWQDGILTVPDAGALARAANADPSEVRHRPLI